MGLVFMLDQNQLNWSNEGTMMSPNREWLYLCKCKAWLIEQLPSDHHCRDCDYAIKRAEHFITRMINDNNKCGVIKPTLLNNRG